MSVRFHEGADPAFAHDGGTGGSGSAGAKLAGIATGPLRVGLSTADITPEGPAWLAGFAARKEVSRGVHRNLTATCVIFDNGETRVAFVALDILWILEKQLEGLRAAALRAGIPPQHLMINFSHTHYAPGIGDERNEAYARLFQARTEPLFQAAADDLQPAALDYTVGSCTMAINRRQLDAEGKINFRPDPRKPIDPDVPILRVLSPEGKVRAVLFGYACHPTSIGNVEEWFLVNTDYPGYARDWIAAAYPGCQPVFLQGCGAEIKPRYTRPDESGYGRYEYVLIDPLGTLAELGHELGRAVVSALMVPPEPVPANRSPILSEAVATPIPLGGIVERVEIAHKNPEKPAHRIHMGAWRVGDVMVFGSQGEIGTQIGMRIKREHQGQRVWTNGYTHWGGGYLMDAASYPGGGYEIEVSGIGPWGEDIVAGNARRYATALMAGQGGLGPIPEP